jgi:AcrR family transcriptional regulator
MTAANRTKKEIVSEFRRAGILKAARKVFARRGFEGATMDEVAEACSIAKGTLYLYFKSKRQIYMGVFKEDLQLLRETSQRAIDAAKTPGEKIRAFVTARLAFCDSHNNSFRIYNSDISAALMRPHPTQKEIKEFYFEQASVLEKLIEEGIRAGELRDVPPRATAFSIYDMTRSMVSRRVLGLANNSSPEVEASNLIDLIWLGIGKEHRKSV